MADSAVLTPSSHLNLELARAMTQAMSAIGIAAAVITPNGMLLAVNTQFEPLICQSIYSAYGTMKLRNSSANALLHAKLAVMKGRSQLTLSIPMTTFEDEKLRIAHLIPVMNPVLNEARNLHSGDNILMVISGGGQNNDMPSPILQAVFDLTPAETKIAKALIEGQSVNSIAITTAKSVHTVRTQLKSILSKTGVGTQSALVVLLKDLSLGAI